MSQAHNEQSRKVVQSTEYYVWCDGSCDNKTTDPAEALQWAGEFRSEGRDDVYIVDVDNNVIDEVELRKLPKCTIEVSNLAVSKFYPVDIDKKVIYNCPEKRERDIAHRWPSNIIGLPGRRLREKLVYQRDFTVVDIERPRQQSKYHSEHRKVQETSFVAVYGDHIETFDSAASAMHGIQRRLPDLPDEVFEERDDDSKEVDRFFVEVANGVVCLNSQKLGSAPSDRKVVVDQHVSADAAIAAFYEQLKAAHPGLDRIDPDSDLLDEFERTARALVSNWAQSVEITKENTQEALDFVQDHQS